MFQKMLQGGSGGSKITFDPQFSSKVTVDSINKIIGIKGKFNITSALSKSDVIISGLPKPKNDITIPKALTRTIGGYTADALVTTNGEVKQTSFDSIASGFEWSYDIEYNIDDIA